MNFMVKLENRFGRFAVKNLMNYIIGITSLLYLISVVENSYGFIQKLSLSPNSILQGEFWRLFTFIFVPPKLPNTFIVFFVLYFYYYVGLKFEKLIGSFKLNLYYIVGMIIAIAFAFITKEFGTVNYINHSILLAFAFLSPDTSIHMFMIPAIKVKYIASFNFMFILYSIIAKPLPYKFSAAAALLNYIIFFGKDLFGLIKNKINDHNNKAALKSYFADNTKVHVCSICGSSSVDNPDLEFRYCTKCDGNACYCMDHIHNHDHK